MFGYIKPFKPQMRVMEFDTYKAVYCGMCHQLGREYGLLARLTLSYDFTFLALLELALAEQPPTFARRRCYANPLRRCQCCTSTAGLQFSCGAAVIALHYKAQDTLLDGGFWQRLGARLFGLCIGRAYRRAKAAYPQLEEAFGTQMRTQQQLEAEGCCSVDAACEPTALALGKVLAQLCSGEANRRVLERFGYLLGRWVYLMDALDDLEEDLRKGRYNPFLRKAQVQPGQWQRLQELKGQAKGALCLTVGEMERTFALLELRRYEGILQNFVEFGFRSGIAQLFAATKKKDDGTV